MKNVGATGMSNLYVYALERAEDLVLGVVCNLHLVFFPCRMYCFCGHSSSF